MVKTVTFYDGSREMKFTDLQPGDIFSFAKSSALYIKVNSISDKVCVFLRLQDGLLLQNSWSGPSEVTLHFSGSELENAYLARERNENHDQKHLRGPSASDSGLQSRDN